MARPSISIGGGRPAISSRRTNVAAVPMKGTMPDLFAQDRATAAAGRSAAISKFEEAMALLDSGAGEETGRKALAAAESNLVGRGLSSSSLPGALSAGITAGIEGDRKTQLSALLTQFAQLLNSPGGPTTVTPGAVLSSRQPTSGGVRSTGRPRVAATRTAAPAAAPAPAPVSGSIFDVDLFGNSPTGGANTPQRFDPARVPGPVDSGGPRRSFDFANDPLELTGLDISGARAFG